MNRLIKSGLVALIIPGFALAESPTHWGGGSGTGSSGTRSSGSGGTHWGGAGETRWGGTGPSTWNDRGGVSRGGAGRAGTASLAPSQHMGIVRNQGIARGIVSQQRVEVVPGHYYYHSRGGTPYWHFYDSRLHWYGFYSGPQFYWLPFYAGYWWWYDVSLARWDYWYDGYWWWAPTGGAVNIYVNGAYTPYNEYAAENSAPAEEPPQPPSAPPSSPPAEAVKNTPAAEGSTWSSPDKKRMVQLVGPQGVAFLYDESGAKPVFIKAIGGNVERVRFSGGAAGKPLRILVDQKDGSFEIFDADGNPAAR